MGKFVKRNQPWYEHGQFVFLSPDSKLTLGWIVDPTFSGQGILLLAVVRTIIGHVIDKPFMSSIIEVILTALGY